ncbi:hypothetical protein Y032_0595g427 [Ancylostoma ceylanicum]|uniref:Uncharacterized protein n=1 Tax=Ancylostoma ceylanicum TaxID=53326 RepID=A0A016WMJ2_9BILA|nr:hypothetical protein Y032_0595g427 [Ancylostoma ceylanicum]
MSQKPYYPRLECLGKYSIDPNAYEFATISRQDVTAACEAASANTLIRNQWTGTHTRTSSVRDETARKGWCPIVLREIGSGMR